MRVLNNCLIKASAGTGKTYALVTRMIRLMLLGVAPDHIVALTFSRAAAGEIYNRLADRLADAAESDAGAQKETGNVFGQAAPALADAIRARCGQAVPRTVFAGLLRQLIATQHTSMIGTIDSFMTRMVQAFPLELGLQGPLTIMDDYRVAREKETAMTALLNRAADTPEAAAFFEAFRQATFGKEGKSYDEKLAAFVELWHDVLLAYPDPSAWGHPEAIWPQRRAVPFTVHDTPEHLAQRLDDELGSDWEAAKLGKQWNDFCAFVRTFNTTFPDQTIIRNVLAAYAPDATACEIKFGRSTLTFTGKQAELIRQTVETLFGRTLQARCEATQGIRRLMEQIEAIYAQNTRSRGLLTFADIPRLIAGLDASVRQNIEYRFDSRFSHWALDEFQDTSLAQWKAVRNLIDEIIQSTDDERSVFIVGDTKQAIYGWRGGDVAIFEREDASGHYDRADLCTTYRYSPQIAAFVNRVFDGDRVAALLAPAARAAGERWQRLWLPHVSKQRDGWVRVERVAPPDKALEERAIDPYLKAACSHFQALRPWERGLSAAVLVRTNDQGAAFAEALRSAGVPAVWEGESAIGDTPVVSALLHALHAAEHPGDTLAWQHVRATPLAQTVFREICARPPDQGATAFSRRVLDDVSRLGLPRALRTYIEAMQGTLDDSFTQMRLDDLIRAATRFAADADARATLADFADFVDAFKTRDVADTSTVKVLTIHRSKGLGFDLVLLPVIENTGAGVSRTGGTLFADDGTWLLTNPGKTVVDADDVLARAKQSTDDADAFEALCVSYVAMTRAKFGLVVLLRPAASAASKTHYFSDHVEEALGEPLPWSDGQPAALSRSEAQPTPAPSAPARAEGDGQPKRRALRRLTPSSAAAFGRAASELFAPREAASLQRGTRLHAALSRIEWIDPASPQPEGLPVSDINLTAPSAFRDALTRPPDAIDLWRERAFESIAGNAWLSGTFDRVVFTETPDGRRADIYDFKSNRRRANETDAAFARRMADTYATQLASYRSALRQLTGLPDTSIRCSLLLTDTLQAVQI